MTRLTWLADELRAAGLRVVEVDGWRTRGSDSFTPEGVTWHATAGSRKATAQGEVTVLLRGSTSAPPPIAQLMIWRDGTIYVVAAGRCNHNLTGWGGPNRGLGNTRLFGIEMANDNKGEPWPAAQLDAARRATAAIMRRLGADPMRRLAAHYEHQPYPAPAGQTSTKTDPRGVDMAAERGRVAALMKEDDDMSFETDQVPVSGPGVSKTNTKWTGPNALGDARDRIARTEVKVDKLLALVAGAAGKDCTDEAAIVAGVLAGLAPEAIAAAIPSDLAAQVVDELTRRLAA